MRLWSSVLLMGLMGTSTALAQPPAPTSEQIEQGLERYRHEPTAQRLVRAALAARSATPGRVRDAMDRARVTGWLPSARGLVRRGQAVDLRALTGDATPTNVSTDDDLVLEARLVFDFDRIVFAPQEPRLLAELRAAEATEAELSAAIVRLYFERRRLQLERDLLRTEDLSRALRILELEALLDAFTAGAFTRMMDRRRGEG